MIASILQVGTYWLGFRRFEKFHVIYPNFHFIIGGTFTLIFHKAIFIKWKPTIVYWIFAVVLLGSDFIGKHTLMHRMLKEKIELPSKIWSRLNLSWALFFSFLRNFKSCGGI